MVMKTSSVLVLGGAALLGFNMLKKSGALPGAKIPARAQYGNVSVPANSTAAQIGTLATGLAPLVTSLANAFNSGVSSGASSPAFDLGSNFDFMAAAYHPMTDMIDTTTPVDMVTASTDFVGVTPDMAYYDSASQDNWSGFL